MPRPPVGRDLSAVAEAIQGSLAPKTWSSYSASWGSWLSFASAEGFSFREPSEATVLAFLSQLIQQRFSFSYVSKTLAGISFFFRLLGLQPCTSYFSVKQALKGYRRLTFVSDSRRPISLDILHGLCKVTAIVCFSKYEALLFKTAFVLAFFGAFRISELVPANKQGTSGIRFEQVVVDQLGVHIWLQQSKTDQCGKGRWVNLCVQEDGIVCPVEAVKQFMGIRPLGKGFFLIHANSMPLTKFQFDAVFKKCLVQMGLTNLKFSSHSFRIGAASEAARVGLPDSDIKEMGRWKSHCFRLYVRPNLFI